MNVRRQSGNFPFEEDPFSKNVQNIGKIYHEVLLMMKILQTKSQVRKMDIRYYDLYYTVIKNRDDKEIVNDKYGNIENDYINCKDIITPNHYVRIKNNNEIIRYRKLRSQINYFNKFLL